MFEEKKHLLQPSQSKGLSRSAYWQTLYTTFKIWLFILNSYEIKMKKIHAGPVPVLQMWNFGPISTTVVGKKRVKDWPLTPRPGGIDWIASKSLRATSL